MAVILGVDFGTQNIEIYQKGKGIILREPNVAAVDARGNVMAVGTEALMIDSRAPGTVTLRRPYSHGVIEDFNLSAEVLDRFLEAAAPRAKKHIVASVKYSLPEESRRILKKAFSDCRTGKIAFVDESIAALMGSGYGEVTDSSKDLGGSLLCDIGAESTEVSYIRGGELLRYKVLVGGTASQNSSIQSYIRSRYGLCVTETVVRELKENLTFCDSPADTVLLSGLDLTTGMPRKISADSEALRGLCVSYIDDTVKLISDMLVNLPRHGERESRADRIILVGGGARLPSIDKYMTHRLGRVVTVADSPMDAVVLGLGKICERE